MTPLFLILIAVIILTCVWLNSVSSRIGIPTLLAFILLGVVFGNVGAIPIRLDNPTFAQQTCTVALIFIMFYGGFGTRWDAVKPVVWEAGLLASVGVILTAVLTGAFCHFVLRWDWAQGLLLGAVLSSTDAASVFSILRSKRLGLRNNTGPMLEVESGSNDPCAYMLTAIMLSVLNGQSSVSSVAWMLFSQIVFGAGCGIGIALLSRAVLRKVHFPTSGFDSLFILAVAIASYAIPDLIGGNGYLSAYLVGMIIGNEDFNNKKSLVSFFDGFTGLMQVLIFFLLGLLARPAALYKAILPALAVFVFMLLVARPMSVFGILTPFRRYGVRQQALVSFVGLRGAASIVFAIMALTDPAPLTFDIFSIVFCIVLISILFQGSLIPWVSRKLDMVDASNDILKTFNDYSENSEMSFGQLDVTADSIWKDRMIQDLLLPKNLLIALIIRGGERILPRGNTVLREGDRVIILTRTFDDTETFLIEKRIKPDSRRVGSRISDYPGTGLIVSVQRGDETIIPHGSTVLAAGDKLTILNIK